MTTANGAEAAEGSSALPDFEHAVPIEEVGRRWQGPARDGIDAISFTLRKMRSSGRKSCAGGTAVQMTAVAGAGRASAAGFGGAAAHAHVPTLRNAAPPARPRCHSSVGWATRWWNLWLTTSPTCTACSLCAPRCSRATCAPACRTRRRSKVGLKGVERRTVAFQCNGDA